MLNGVEQNANTTGRCIVAADEERNTVLFFRVKPNVPHWMAAIVTSHGQIVYRAATGKVSIRPAPLD